MNTTLKPLLVLFATIWLGTNYASAQQYQRPRQRTYDAGPTVSPYLKLSPALNQNNELQYIDGAYQNYVRPQIQQRERFKQQQLQITQLRTKLDRAQVESTFAGQPLQTGHGSRFQSYSHFYPQLGARKR